jgi:thiol-disulfide isomerase/thioredoxin
MKNSKWRQIVSAGLLAGLVAAAGCSWGPSSGRSPGEELHQPAPQFTVAGLDGKSLTLNDFSGKILVVNFWASWCGPCREEIPHFSKLYADYKSKGVEFLGISMDEGEVNEVRDLVQEFSHKQRVEYLLAIGNPDVANAFGGVSGLPTTFVIDRKGTIIKKYTGYSPIVTEDIELILKKLMG